MKRSLNESRKANCLFRLLFLIMSLLFLVSILYGKPVKRRSKDYYQPARTFEEVRETYEEKKRKEGIKEGKFDRGREKKDEVNNEDEDQVKESFLRTPLCEKNPRMDFQIQTLLRRWTLGGREEALREARKLGFEEKAGMIKMIVEVQQGREADIIERIIQYGGKVLKWYENRIEVYLPPEGITELLEEEEVSYIRKPLHPVLMDVQSQGVSVSGATQWQSLNLNYLTPDHPVKVAILDVGFSGYDLLLGSELPSQIIINSFTGDITGGGEVHGTACAEIIYDMAPDSILYLVNISNSIEHSLAIDYLISEQVDIISASFGWFNTGAGDGTGPICEEVRRATNSGIIWVNAAGNEANKHWEGIFRDENNNGWHEFTPDDESLDVYLRAGYPVTIYLNWDDWELSDQDFDLYLLDDQSLPNVVAKSLNAQDGHQWPVEEIDVTPSVSGTYHILIDGQGASKSLMLELFLSGYFSDMEYVVPEGSLIIPADSPDVLAVGAVDWSHLSLEPFSSWGPTLDGRTKPDLCGYDGVKTTAYQIWQGVSFYGTSAATPHVAGAIALLKSKIGPYRLNQIVEILKARAQDIEVEGPDNKSGYGRLNLLRR